MRILMEDLGVYLVRSIDDYCMEALYGDWDSELGFSTEIDFEECLAFFQLSLIRVLLLLLNFIWVYLCEALLITCTFLESPHLKA